ncbi:MAG: ABC-type transport system involved in multi-copper enzyme maturation permease subunit [Planctomycetota bacterium]|jgi:ABC-type transport system involved in multi-copper enzyme maturation permease subunit
MKGTGRVFRAELYRLTRSRTAWFGLFAVTAIAAIRVFAAHISDNAGHAEALSQALLAGRALPEAPPAGNAYAPLVEGWLAGLTVGTLLLLVHSARTIAGDRESGLLRLARTRSASRNGLVIGRFLLGTVLVLSLIAFSGLGSWGATTLFFDFGPLVEDGYELISEHELLEELHKAVVASIPALIATYAFGLMISAFGRTATGSVGFCLALFFAFDLFKDVIGAGQVWVFASFAPSLVDKSCLHEMVGIASGYSDAGYTEFVLRMNHVVPWPEALLFLCVACWIVSRRPL